MSAASPSPDPTNMLMLAVLGIGAYWFMTQRATAGTTGNSGWLAGRNFLQSPAQASQAGNTAAGLGSLLSGVKGLFGGSSSGGSAGTQTQAEALNVWTRIENANRVDPLYQTGIKDYYGTSNTGDPYNSGYDSVAANPSPLVPWDSWFTGTGGMGD